MKVLTVTCPRCGKKNKLAVPLAGLKKYQEGAPVQAAFPDLSAEHREMLISGLCLGCQDEVFKEDEEEI